jgi:hypothetical protein
MDDPARRVAQVLDIFHRHDLNWIAWCMHPSADPCVIADWNYTPTPYFGALVKGALEGNWPTVPSQRTSSEDKLVYHDSLQNNWQSWANGDFASSEVVHTGSKSIRADLKAGQSVMLGSPPFNSTPYRAVRLWLNGGASGGQSLQIAAQVGEKGLAPVRIPALAPNTWQQVEVSFEDLGIVGIENLKGFRISCAIGGDCPVFYIDDVTVIGRRP